MTHITPVPAFRDNYIWIAHQGKKAVIVDPGDAAPVEHFIRQHALEPIAILVTHFHHDHVGGIAALRRRYPVPVYGPPPREGVAVDHPVGDGDEISLPPVFTKLEVIGVPGHTREHIAYYQTGVLFAGDTIFGCGCGRLRDGTAGQLHRSLERLAQLPDDTRVYCAHEYTLANIRFAQQVDPNNHDLAARAAREKARRDKGQPTLPSLMAEERRTNPFLRCAAPAVRKSVEAHAQRALLAEADVFSELRLWKDLF